MTRQQIQLLDELKNLSGSTVPALSEEAILMFMSRLGTSDTKKLLGALVQISLKYIGELDGAKEYASAAARHWDKMDQQEMELIELKQKNASLKRSLDVANRNVAELRTLTAQPQTSKVKCGERIAYRDDITTQGIYEMLSDGMTVTQIADALEVSRNLVYRRIAELKASGVDVDELKATAKARKNDDRYHAEESDHQESLFDVFFSDARLTPEMLQKRMNL